jgi:hypothetical protein
MLFISTGIFDDNNIICCGNKIAFLWEQDNKLWEQDITLREEDIFVLAWP